MEAAGPYKWPYKWPVTGVNFGPTKSGVLGPGPYFVTGDRAAEFHLQDPPSKNGPWVLSRNSEAVRHGNVRISRVQTRCGDGVSETHIFFCWVGKTPRFNNQSGVVNVFEVEVLCSTLSWMTLISSQRGGGSTSWFLQGFCNRLKTTPKEIYDQCLSTHPYDRDKHCQRGKDRHPRDRMISDRVWGCMVVHACPIPPHFCVEHESPWYLLILPCIRRNPSLSPQDVYNVQPAIDIWLLIHCTQTGFHPGHETHWLVSVETCRKVHSQNMHSHFHEGEGLPTTCLKEVRIFAFNVTNPADVVEGLTPRIREARGELSSTDRIPD